MLSNIPIQRKLMTVILVVCGTVLLLTCIAFFAYEYITYRKTAAQQIEIIGKIISSNSTAALAFDNEEDADEIMSSLKAEPGIVAACLYDERWKIFSVYPLNTSPATFPKVPTYEGYRFNENSLEGFESIVQGNKKLGTLYLKSDLKGMIHRFTLYGLLALSILLISFVIAWLLTRRLQRSISRPILSLVETARLISGKHDYSVRAEKFGDDELGSLTDALNQMLTQIEGQNLEITTFNQKLEQKVEERTNELEVANQELESFSYSVSHDLRAPLRRINMFVQLFTERFSDKLDEEGLKLLNSITKNSAKMSQLINDLLAFARVGKLEMAKSEISMNAIVRSICQDVTKAEEKRKLDFRITTLPGIFADSVTMTQVWENLISNAVKFTRNKPAAIIEIGAEVKDNEVIYHITDNGSGFDMSAYSKLFTAFQRLHSTSQFDGTGIGLAIVERIISKHGGKVWATGKEDEGATFYFSLTLQNKEDINPQQSYAAITS
jgi:signal transduction histidine kinase